MTFERKAIGEPYSYKGRKIVLRIVQPDLLCEVDGRQVGSFWLDWESGLAAGKRHIDDEEKAAAEAAAKTAKAKRGKK